MNEKLLVDIGLTANQAKVYICLIKNGPLTPLEVADKLGITRTNSYMLINKLGQKRLIQKVEKSKPSRYSANNPTALEELVFQKKQSVNEIDNQIKVAMPMLLSYFYSFTEKTGIRMLQGIDGLKEIYTDTLRRNKDIYLLRSTSDIDYLGREYLDRYRKKRARLGIKTFAYTPQTQNAIKHMQDGLDEKKYLFFRKMLSLEDYKAPVEIDIYGDKTVFLVFGEEIMALQIDSPQIADAMRQVFKLFRTK